MGNFARRNTVSFDLAHIEEKPSALEIHLYIQEVLKLTVDVVEAIGMYGTKTIIKLKMDSQVEDLFENYAETEFTDRKGKKWPINLRNESSKSIVRIHKIPMEIPDDEIIRVLSRYGKVEEVSKDKWKNMPFPVYNENRTVKMEIIQAIPSYVNIDNKLYWVTYYGQQKTCRRCNGVDHEARDCKYNANRRVQNYADRVRTQNYTKDFFPEFENESAGRDKKAGQQQEITTKLKVLVDKRDGGKESNEPKKNTESSQVVLKTAVSVVSPSRTIEQSREQKETDKVVEEEAAESWLEAMDDYVEVATPRVMFAEPQIISSDSELEKKKNVSNRKRPMIGNLSSTSEEEEVRRSAAKQSTRKKPKEDGNRENESPDGEDDSLCEDEEY